VTIKIEPVPWCDEAAVGLSRALGDDLRVMRDEVESNRAQLWKVHGYGFLVTRIESDCNGKTLVLVAAEGRGIDAITPVLIDVAKANGIGFLRVHSARKGMGRILKKHGYRYLETVYLLEVSGNG